MEIKERDGKVEQESRAVGWRCAKKVWKGSNVGMEEERTRLP